MFEIADPNAPVFVQLIAHGSARNLALPPNEEHALVVGSQRDADFQIDGPRVAPVQFHLERYDRGVWLIPAYSVHDLRLNGAAVVGPTPLEEHNIVVFAGVHLEVAIRDADEFVASGDSLFTEPPSRREFRASYSIELPSEEDATHLAVAREALVPEDEWPTAESQPIRQQSPSPQQQITERIAPLRAPTPTAIGPNPDFTLFGTQIIPKTIATLTAAASSHPVVHVQAVAPSPNAVPQSVARPDETLRLVPLRNAPRPQPIPPRPVPRTVEHRDAARTNVTATASEPNVVTPPPPTRLAPRPARHPSLLTRLGLLTKTRPLLVGCCAAFGAVLLAIALLAISRIAAPQAAERAAQRARSPISTSNNTLPALAPSLGRP